MKNYIERGYQPMSIQLEQSKREEIIKTLSVDLASLIQHLRQFKSSDRTELDRRFAIAITDAEKLDAYISHYILAPIASND